MHLLAQPPLSAWLTPFQRPPSRRGKAPSTRKNHLGTQGTPSSIRWVSKHQFRNPKSDTDGDLRQLLPPNSCVHRILSNSGAHARQPPLWTLCTYLNHEPHGKRRQILRTVQTQWASQEPLYKAHCVCRLKNSGIWARHQSTSRMNFVRPCCRHGEVPRILQNLAVQVGAWKLIQLFSCSNLDC